MSEHPSLMFSLCVILFIFSPPDVMQDTLILFDLLVCNVEWEANGARGCFDCLGISC